MNILKYSHFFPPQKKKSESLLRLLFVPLPPPFFFSFTSYFTLNQAKSILLMEYLLWDVHF